MESNTQPLAEIALFIDNGPTHMYPFLAHLTHLKSQGLNFDVYGPPNFKGMFGKISSNIYEFEELGILSLNLHRKLHSPTWCSTPIHS